MLHKLDVGHVVEWDLSSGDQIEHKVHGGTVFDMALSGDRIVTCDDFDVIRVSNLSTCSLVLLSQLIYL